MSGVGVLPQRQEIVVRAFRLHGIARERERSRQLQARHGVHGIDEHDASVIENPLELADGFGGLTAPRGTPRRERRWGTGRRSVR